MKSAIFFLAVSAFAAPTLFQPTPATQTTAVIGIRGYTGSCTLALSTSPSFSPVIPDVDNSLYAGSNVDTTRPDTYLWSDSTRIVTFGHNIDDRALSTATTYYLQVSGCGTTATTSWTTPTLSSGSTQQWPVPFDSTKPWNYGYPQINLLAHGATYTDPITGTILAPLNIATDGTWRTGIVPYLGPNCCAGAALGFTYFSGGSGWTTPTTLSAGTPKGASGTAITANTNTLDVYGDGAVVDPWGGTTLDDLGFVLYGSATNLTSTNNQVKACIFTDPTVGCLGTPLTISIPSGTFGAVPSASSDADAAWPNNFPTPYFAGWGLTSPLGPDHVNTTGTLNAVAGVLTDASNSRLRHFPSTMVVGQKIFVNGSAAQGCVNNLCTLASYQNYSQITVSENLTISNATYTTLMWGVRIQKVTATGSVTLGAAFKNAGSRALGQPAAAGPVCNQHGFTSGDGHFGYICEMIPTEQGGMMLYFVSSDGTVRQLYGGIVPGHFTGPTCFTPQNSDDMPNPSQFSVGGLIPDATDARTWYVYTGNGLPDSPHSLYKLVYGGDTTESLSYMYGLTQFGDGFIRNAPCDLWAWTNVMPVGHDLQTQVAATYPSYNTGIYGNWSTVGGTIQYDGNSGKYAYFDNNYSGQDGGPAWVLQVDITTNPATVNNLIHTADGTGTGNRVMWGAHHNTGPSNTVPNLFTLSENMLKSNDSSKLHGGPFTATILGVQRSGSFNANTALPWPIDSSYDNTCPGGNPYVFMGATGNQCVVIELDVGGVCNVAPTTTEKATWPCPWNAAFAQPFSLKVGSIFSDPALQIDAEKLRVVQVTTIAGGKLSVIAQRNAMWDYCCIGAKGGVNNCVDGTPDNQHANGWSIQMYPPNLNGCAAGGYTIDAVTGVIQEAGRLLNGHSDYFPGVTPGNVSFIGADWIQNIASKPNLPPDHLFSLPTSYLMLKSPTFNGVSLAPGAGAVQSYPHSPGSMVWMTDSNTMNGNLGLGPELVINNIGGRSLVKTGTTNVYKISVLGTVSYKQFPLLGWAGRYLLGEISGPGSNVDSTAWTLCYAYFNGECHSSSVAGEVYVNVPGVGDFAQGSPLAAGVKPGGNTGNGPIFNLAVLGGAHIGIYTVRCTTAGVNSATFTVTNPLGSVLGTVSYSGSGASGNFANEVAFTIKDGDKDFIVGDGYDLIGTCPTGQSWAIMPCIISGFPSGGGMRQTRFDVADPTSGTSRLLTYLLTSPGEHYPFSAFYSLPDGKAAIASPHELQNWGTVSMLVTLPPWNLNSVNRTTTVPLSVTIPAGGPTYAEVQFGYLRYGTPSQFYCTPRAEACNTSGTPFNFESETRALKTCSGGCTIPIPVQSPNQVYYRIRRSNDGVTWTNQDVIPYAVP